METDPSLVHDQTLDLEAALAITEEEILREVVLPSGGEDGRRYEIYATRCPSPR